MMHIKSSTAIAAVLAAISGFSPLASSTAQADPRHWFYDNYDQYDDRAYYDDGYDYYQDEEGEYFVYAPPPRRVRPGKWQRRKQRLRRWAIREGKRALRREIRKNRANRNRPGRQRLYDAWQEDQYGQYEPRHHDQAKKAKPRKTVRLSYVPLPRTKPYHLIPAQKSAPVVTNRESVKKYTLEKTVKIGNLDKRPVWQATPKKKAVAKKDIEVATLPKVFTPSRAKSRTATDFKPIRIEMVKDPKAAEFRQPRTSGRKLTSNQLSCDKAKSIVSGFGFSNITTLSCTGAVYGFNAKRDGKPYSVKVSSLSGELKGVKKIK